MKVSKRILNKHAVAIDAARKYWVLNQPTGFSDHDFNVMEENARQDGLELRNYVCSELSGKRAQNGPYMTKVPKIQVPDDITMTQAIMEYCDNVLGTRDMYFIPKYDGSSLAIYYNSDGTLRSVITVGGDNLGSEGIDQTYKFKDLVPQLPEGTGICCLQAECLVALEHGFAEKSRFKANGLVTSKYLESDITEYANLRCFRYFLDPSYPGYERTSEIPYQVVLSNLPVVTNVKGDIKFCGGFCMTMNELLGLGDNIEKDIWSTPTGTFLVDGIVCYDIQGHCIQALKYRSAGRAEATEVLGIKWNDQSKKGKDSWSANALIKPVIIRGTEVKKPSVGSVKKIIEKGLSKGAKVTIIMANSTIPMVSEVIDPGNLDPEWPKCSCGYQMGTADIFGSLLKCGNPNCSCREARMTKYLETLEMPADINLSKLFVIDRFVFPVEPSFIIEFWGILDGSNNPEELKNWIISKFPNLSALQMRNLELVYRPAWKSLKNYYGERRTRNTN